jgi:hypothetical protein
LKGASFRSASRPVLSPPLFAGEAIADDKVLAREAVVSVNKITWAQAGHVTDPGRYMFRFGWLTITADDLVVWKAYPNAAFTLISGTAPPPAEGDEQPPGEEFRLGLFELPVEPDPSDNEK